VNAGPFLRVTARFCAREAHTHLRSSNRCLNGSSTPPIAFLQPPEQDFRAAARGTPLASVAEMTRALLFIVIGTCAGLSACGGGGDGGGGSSSSLPLSCEEDCERQIAAGCEKMPPNYYESCVALCDYVAAAVPEQCQKEHEAMRACVATKITYSCNANQTLQASPTGACSKEGAACFACSPSCLPL
jgi:hypothetical protein